jgi:Family of unknown function (DUF6526)
VQNYSNHVRWHPPFHFVMLPILLIHFFWSIVRLVQEPGWATAESLLLSIGLLLLMLQVRLNPLRVQDRLIRLEEQLRMQRLLPADLAARGGALPESFLVALRFAPDEELRGLVEEAVNGGFARPDDAKRAIKNWRADLFRV